MGALVLSDFLRGEANHSGADSGFSLAPQLRCSSLGFAVIASCPGSCPQASP